MTNPSHLTAEAASAIALAGELGGAEASPAHLVAALLDADQAVHALVAELKLDEGRIKAELAGGGKDASAAEPSIANGQSSPGTAADSPGPLAGSRGLSGPRPGGERVELPAVVDQGIQVAWSFGEHKARGLHLLLASFGTRSAEWNTLFSAEDLPFERVVQVVLSEIGGTCRGARERRRLLEGYWQENGSMSPVAGTGADLCLSRGYLRTPGAISCDGVLCLTLLGVPLVALRHVHAFAWNPEPGSRFWTPQPATQVEIPIRATPAAAALAIARRVLAVACVTGIAFLLLAFFGPPGAGGPFEQLAAMLIPPYPMFCLVMGWANRRNAMLRCILGDHDMGNSDPVYWLPEYLATLPDSWTWFGTGSYLEAAGKLLQEGNLRGAMWAARVSVAKEDAARGEAATDAILEDGRARAMLDAMAPGWIG